MIKNKSYIFYSVFICIAIFILLISKFSADGDIMTELNDSIGVISTFVQTFVFALIGAIIWIVLVISVFKSFVKNEQQLKKNN